MKSEVDGLHRYFYRLYLLSASNNKSPVWAKIEFQSRESHPRCIPLDLGLLSVKTRTFLRLFLLPANREMVLENRGPMLYSVNSLTQECK